jgi:hypothetical protein
MATIHFTVCSYIIQQNIMEPDSAALSSLAETISKAAHEYASASSGPSKIAALRALQSASKALSNASTPVPDQLAELNLRPYVNVCIRIGIDMGLFDALPEDGKAVSVAELAATTGAEEQLILRICRLLGTYDVLQCSYTEDGKALYAHTLMSRLTVAHKPIVQHLFDDVLSCLVQGIGWFRNEAFREPFDGRNTPFAYATGTVGATFFEAIDTMPERSKRFNEAMAGAALMGLDETVAQYPFDKLGANQDGISLVDVGGGKGHVLNAIAAAFPTLKGGMALQDLKAVLDGGVLVDEKEVVVQPLDFFGQIEPIKGTNTISPATENYELTRLGSNYLLRAILHDWPDKDCLQILANIKPAMTQNSKLLICDFVLEDVNPPNVQALRDVNMLAIGGKERSSSQWKELLANAGFEIVKVYGGDGGLNGIIEAELKRN